MEKKYIYLLGIFWIIGLSTASAQTAWFRRDTATVLRMADKTLLNPWAGGLNAAQYSKMHLNDDGVEDLVIFDRTNNKVSTFLADATTQTYRYAPVYEARFPATQNWMLLVDYNQDGHKELFTHTAQGVRVYRQRHSASGWEWVLFKPLLRTIGFSGPLNLLVVATDIPALLDIDDDGDLDIVTFEQLGNYAEMHLNISMEKYGVPDSLEFIRNGLCWGNFVKEECNDFSLGVDCGSLENPGGYSPVGRTLETARINHAGNALLLHDLNGDGKKDMLFGHVSCENLAVLYNTGTNRVGNFTSFSPNYPAQNPVNFIVFPAGYLEDVDFDGKKDLLAAPNVYVNEANLMDFRSSNWYFHNAGTDTNPNFVLQQKNFLQDHMLEVGENASPAFFDVDGDGDLDLVIGTGGVLRGNGFRASLWLLRNVGTTREPRYELASENYLGLADQRQVTNIKPQWADFNGDGVVDLGFGSTSGRDFRYQYIPNRAAPGQPVQLNLAEVVTLPIPTETQTGDTPHFYDVDGDGDLDLVVGKSQGNIYYYLNTGTASQPVYTLQTETLAGVGFNYPGRFAGLAVADIDLDGRPDLLTADQTGMVRVFHSGTWGQWSRRDSLLVEHPLTQQGYAPQLGTYLQPTVADYNGDGKPDLAVGTNAGGIHLFTNILSATITAPEPTYGWDVRLFPNPADRYLRVESAVAARVEVLNARGIPLYSTPFSVQAQQELVLSTEHWVPGLYLIRLSSVSGVLVRKIVVVR
ncbi:hypothetical protein GCM10027275_32570 [Rhabdobacter roseus]|uniref:Uncharacterized protein (DUF2141 family) n=1 Tax=Rhabdobacter roseus TaxID=1655419 RepID=A0A840TP51_9BACT|nr:T9SS type A sorting domain-containing protein [Rhabdobacter roseus]MBB5285521.1 uncharacterized protein (DUF2141 family) [Rhabdobacter roseus]